MWSSGQKKQREFKSTASTLFKAKVRVNHVPFYLDSKLMCVSVLIVKPSVNMLEQPLTYTSLFYHVFVYFQVTLHNIFNNYQDYCVLIALDFFLSD